MRSEDTARLIYRLVLGAMRTGLCVDTFICQTKPRYRTPANQMLRNDLLGVFRTHMAIPDRFRINHNGRTMLTLVKTPGFINADPACKAGSFGKHLQLGE